MTWCSEGRRKRGCPKTWSDLSRASGGGLFSPMEGNGGSTAKWKKLTLALYTTRWCHEDDERDTSSESRNWHLFWGQFTPTSQWIKPNMSASQFQFPNKQNPHKYPYILDLKAFPSVAINIFFGCKNCTSRHLANSARRKLSIVS